MSFRNDGQRRYGHVPPVQYPVSGQQQSQDQSSHPGRRPSFNSGDDSSFFDQGHSQSQSQSQSHSQYHSRGRSQSIHSARGEQELFLTSPTDPNPPLSHRPSQGSTSSALSGYQHQYRSQAPPTPSSHSSYNPQHFAHSQSTSLPYHPRPSQRHSVSSASGSIPPTSPTNFTPAAYNPAAYANTSVPQRQPTYSGYSNYNPGYTSPTVPQTPSAFGHSPSATYNPAFPQQSTTQPPLPSPGISSNASTTSQTPSYDPSYNQGGYTNNNYGAYASNGGSPGLSHQPSSAQTPYPIHSQIPVGPQYSTDPYNRTSRSNSQASPLSSPTSHSQGLYRHPTNAPLPTRPPMDEVPEESSWEPGRRNDDDNARLQDDIMQDIENELSGSSSRHRPMPLNGLQISPGDLQQLRRPTLDLIATQNHMEPSNVSRISSNASTANRLESSNVSRFSSNASTANRDAASSTFEYEVDDDDDPEGTAGVLAMQQAEIDERRFSSISSSAMPFTSAVPAQALQPTAEEQSGEGQSSDTDYGGTDLGLFSGGYAGKLAYDDNAGSPSNDATPQQPPPPTISTQHARNPSSHDESAPAFRDAEVDYGGTGGLQPPTAHRLSFDEGDERVSVDSRQSGSDSLHKEDYPDIFYHPGLTNRPLPPLPPAPGSDSSSLPSVQSPAQPRQQHSHKPSLSVDSRYAQHPEGPEAYYGSQAGQGSLHPERSISLSSHSNTPHVYAPVRSRTDAAEERRRMAKQMAQQPHLSVQTGVSNEGYDTGTPSSMSYDMITLPSGRRKKFVPSKLTSADFRECTEPWALSGIAAWVREMADGEPDLKQKSVEEALVNLFTERVPTLNVADAEVLSTKVVGLMLESKILVPEEEWVKFGPGEVSGVLWQLTGSGCYASKLHEPEAPGRCYSYHCMRTLKKANLEDLMLEEVKSEDWATFYKMTKDGIEGKGKKEIERQNVMHEIVTSEEGYMNQLEVLRVLYRDQIRNAPSPIIAPNRVDKFLTVVFGKVDAVQATNKENLLAQLKYRQQEQGPWIGGFSDLFREWIRKARDVYIDYASQYPHASYLVRKEADRNIIFSEFLDRVRSHKRSNRLDWTHFLKTPITRLQRYTFLLQTVEKNMLQDSEEKANLTKAIAEIHTVTLECDAKVAEMQKKVEMMELNAMLVLRPGFHSVLNLDHLGRELILQGELQRMGSKGVSWVDTHALLFDHYCILAKPVHSKDGRGGKKFDVSKEPIPMPLLFLDSMNDDPISKQKGITAPLARNTGAAPVDSKLNKVTTNGSDRPSLEHATTGSSISSVAVTRLAPTMSNEAKDRILYPFKLKHLGHETYTLYATTAEKRADWVQKIVEAKTRHAKALFSQNAEPFRLRVLADRTFAYDSVSAIGKHAGVPVRGTPLDRAIRELEKVYGPGRAPAPACRAQVNCATGFSAYGRFIIAIGTDYGVYISDATDPRGWVRTVHATRVQQITVLEEFSVCVIIADKSLISYPLDVVAPVSNFPAPVHDSPRRAPQKLGKDVAFFASAKMKERMLLFYKRKEGMHNTFKVLEPVFQKSTEKKSRLFGGRKGGGSGSTDSFRDYDEFYLPTECFSLNLLNTYIAVSTARGFELLTLDKKQTMSIPDVREPAIANIANRIRDQRPLGMFRLNDQEFLLAYEDCAVYVDKHGDVSRTLIMEYSGKQKKARGATMYGQYLLLFNEDYVEVRNAENGRLRQIIAGRDVKCLDYGVRGATGHPSLLAGTGMGTNNNNNNSWNSSGGGGQQNHQIGEESKGTVKISMSHPEVSGMQIVLEMLLNDGHMEKQ